MKFLAVIMALVAPACCVREVDIPMIPLIKGFKTPSFQFYLDKATKEIEEKHKHPSDLYYH